MKPELKTVHSCSYSKLSKMATLEVPFLPLLWLIPEKSPRTQKFWDSSWHLFTLWAVEQDHPESEKLCSWFFIVVQKYRLRKRIFGHLNNSHFCPETEWTSHWSVQSARDKSGHRRGEWEWCLLHHFERTKEGFSFRENQQDQNKIRVSDASQKI